MRIAFKIKTRMRFYFKRHQGSTNNVRSVPRVRQLFFVYAKDFSLFVYAFFPIAYRPLLIGKSSS